MAGQPLLHAEGPNVLAVQDQGHAPTAGHGVEEG